jgi:hypothetical protein
MNVSSGDVGGAFGDCHHTFPKDTPGESIVIASVQIALVSVASPVRANAKIAWSPASGQPFARIAPGGKEAAA